MKRHLVSGRLCLDLVNTVAWRDREVPEDRLGSYDALLRFARLASAIGPSEMAVLRRRARREREQARLALDRARAFRETLYRLILAWRSGQPPDAVDSRELDAVLAAAPERRRLQWVGGRFEWSGKGRAALEAPLWRPCWSAADLLTEDNPSRVKTCAGTGCGWLFEDRSRAGSRRWCAMEDCGNRAKARRFYARVREARSGSG